MTKVKICGITNLEDALVSTKFGADALGFNFYAKSPRYITPENAREIIEQLPGNILKVGVFVNENLEKIIEIAETAKIDALQLHGEETPEFARELKAKTNLEIIKAFRVSPDFKPEDVLQYDTDAILLDAYSRHEHGGTGETFDWEIAKKVQKNFPKMYLAGGIDNENIVLAISNLKPFAVDVCSGVEAIKGKKDNVKLINFILRVKNHAKKFIPSSFYDFLEAVQLRPVMYLGWNKLSLMRSFLGGFQTAVSLSNANYDTGKFFTDFNQWAINKLTGRNESKYGWSGIILRECNNDEEKALELFFALLEEFKLEKEDLSNE